MTPQEKLKRIIENAKGDDLERARRSFHGMSSRQLDEQHGQSGRTRRQILQEYEAERALYLQAAALVEPILRNGGRS